MQVKSLALLHWVGAAALLALHCAASAVPPQSNAIELGKLSESNAQISLDVRQYWQAGVIGVGDLPHTKVSSPEALWSIPDAEFKIEQEPASVQLVKGQRYVGRLNMTSTGFGANIYLNFLMPRLDAVHMAYRYDQEPWVQASAGDTLAMNTWSFRDRQPTFDIPLRTGNLNIVVEVAHLGVMDSAIVLQSASVFRDERLFWGLTVGLLVGINLLLALVGIASAFTFGRMGFLSITLMTTVAAGMVSTTSGMLGVYAFPDSVRFNDEAKFFASNLWCVVFPWVTALALSQRQYAVKWWRVTLAVVGTGIALTVACMGYGVRSAFIPWVPLVLLMCIAHALAILGHAFLRKQTQAFWIAPAVFLYVVSLLLPLASYLGHVSNDGAIVASALATLLAAMVLLRALVHQHRQGRMVMARASTSPSRDVLTGLLSRKGFEQTLARNVQRMNTERIYAAFYYVKVSDAQTLQARYGDEGFEVGMVQLAAALSSSISVVDTVGRVAPNAFAVTVLMPRDAKLANAMAQKILTRTMALASHGAPLAQTARIAIAWLPVFGTLLPDIERRALRALRKMDEGKRIAWVGGAHAQDGVSIQTDGLTHPTTKPHNGQEADNALPSLPGMINRLEREMLGPDSTALRAQADGADADKLMRMLLAGKQAQSDAKISQP